MKLTYNCNKCSCSNSFIFFGEVRNQLQLKHLNRKCKKCGFNNKIKKQDVKAIEDKATFILAFILTLLIIVIFYYYLRDYIKNSDVIIKICLYLLNIVPPFWLFSNWSREYRERVRLFNLS